MTETDSPTIRTVVFDQPGGPEVLHVARLPRSEFVPPRSVRVRYVDWLLCNALLGSIVRSGSHTQGVKQRSLRIAAAGINRAETLQRKGKSAVPESATSPHLGLEASGIVTEVGADVARWKTGSRVMLLANGGGYSQEIVIDEGKLLPIPDDWTDIEAAAFMETTLTAFLNIFWYGGLESARLGNAVLVHGGGSGVGTQAIKLCKAKGIRVIVTAGSDEKCTRCLEVGADVAINYKTQQFEEVVLQQTNGNGVNMVLDHVGGSYLSRDLACLARDGHIVFIGLIGGGLVAELDLGKLMAKRAHVIGSTLRSRDSAFKDKLIADLEAQFGPHIIDGTLRPVIDSTFPFEQAADAHRLMEADKNFGKIVLTVH